MTTQVMLGDSEVPSHSEGRTRQRVRRGAFKMHEVHVEKLHLEKGAVGHVLIFYTRGF